MIFPNFTKAFDTIPHSILPDKLSSCELNRFMLCWVMNWARGGSEQTQGKMYLLSGWSNTRMGFLERWPMPRAGSLFTRHMDNALSNVLLVRPEVLRQLDLVISEGPFQLNYPVLSNKINSLETDKGHWKAWSHRQQISQTGTLNKSFPDQFLPWRKGELRAHLLECLACIWCLMDTFKTRSLVERVIFNMLSALYLILFLSKNIHRNSALGSPCHILLVNMVIKYLILHQWVDRLHFSTSLMISQNASYTTQSFLNLLVPSLRLASNK